VSLGGGDGAHIRGELVREEGRVPRLSALIVVGVRIEKTGGPLLGVRGAGSRRGELFGLPVVLPDLAQQVVAIFGRAIAVVEALDVPEGSQVLVPVVHTNNIWL